MAHPDLPDLPVLVISVPADRRDGLSAAIEAMKSQPAMLAPLAVMCGPGGVEPLRGDASQRVAPMSSGSPGNPRILRGARAC